ncbi:MAG TPA: NAD(P)-binding protein [Bryobacteraceae bacterium]|nr:NAD(P)-binding protein [Bryobacteraceae bacterium]
MGTSEEHRDLGMDRQIARRDFLNGVAIGIAGVSAAVSAANAQAQPAGQAANYPPTRSGLRGNYPAAIAEFDHIRSGQYTQFPVAESEIREEYDLVIVGGGISGLAAAHFYRTALGTNQRILILDNHDDFGGHAKRNEFHYNGRTLIGVGGTLGIATPFPYSYAAKSLVKELGIEVERNAEFLNHDLEQKHGLAAGTFFDKEHFGEDRLVRGNPHLPDFFAKAPLSEAARKDLIRLYGKNPDYMAGMSAHEKRAKLAKMSYQDYLLNFAKISPDALPFFIGAGGRNNKRVDTTPALEAGEHGLAGFNGLGLKLEESFSEASYLFHFPDGNASLARLLISKLIPEAVPGKQSMNTILDAPVAYDRLDEATSKMRIRLSSPVLRVENDGPPESATSVRIAYRNGDKISAVRARYCILACYNALIPALLPEIPDRQKEALAYPVKVPMMYTNVLIRRWTAWQKLGVSRVSAPGMYHTSMNLDPGSTVGGYRGMTTPDEPIVVHMVRSPNKPGLPRKEQNRAGQQELLSMSFEDFELKIRQQMARTLAPGGFDPREDILAITVNRWPYGYAYTYDTLADPDVPFEQRPHVIGRQRCGRVTIANSDAGAAAFTNQAIDEANRAVQELFLLQGLS